MHEVEGALFNVNFETVASLLRLHDEMCAWNGHHATGKARTAHSTQAREARQRPQLLLSKIWIQKDTSAKKKNNKKRFVTIKSMKEVSCVSEMSSALVLTRSPKSPKKGIGGRVARSVRLRPLGNGRVERLVLEVHVSGVGEVGKIVVGPQSSIHDVRREIKARLFRRVPARFAFLVNAEAIPIGVESSRAAVELAPRILIVPRQGALSQVMSSHNQAILEKAREILIEMMIRAAITIQKHQRASFGRRLFALQKKQILEKHHREQVIHHRDQAKRNLVMKKLGNSMRNLQRNSNIVKQDNITDRKNSECVKNTRRDSRVRFSLEDHPNEQPTPSDGTIIAHTSIKMNHQRRLARVRVEQGHLVADVFVRRTKRWLKRVVIDTEQISAREVVDSEQQKRICRALADRLQYCNADTDELIHLILPHVEDESTLGTSTTDQDNDANESSDESDNEDQVASTITEEEHDSIEKRTHSRKQQVESLSEKTKTEMTSSTTVSNQKQNKSAARRKTLETSVQRTRVLAQGVLLSGKKALAMIFKGDDAIFDIEVLLVENNSKMIKASVNSSDIIAAAELSESATHAEIAAAILPRLAIRKRRRKGGYELRVHMDVSKALASNASCGDLLSVSRDHSVRDLDEGLLNIVSKEKSQSTLLHDENTQDVPSTKVEALSQATEDETHQTKDTFASNAPELIYSSFVTMHYQKFLCRATEAPSSTAISFKIYGRKGQTRTIQVDENRWQPTFGPLTTLQAEEKARLCQILMKRIDVVDTNDVEKGEIILSGEDDCEIEKRKQRNILSAKAKAEKTMQSHGKQKFVYTRGTIVSGERVLCRLSFDDDANCNVEAVLSSNGKKYVLRLDAATLSKIPIYAVLNLKQRGDAICDRLSFRKRGAKKRSLVYDFVHSSSYHSLPTEAGESEENSSSSKLSKKIKKDSSARIIQQDLDKALSEARSSLAQTFSDTVLKSVPLPLDIPQVIQEIEPSRVHISPESEEDISQINPLEERNEIQEKTPRSQEITLSDHEEAQPHNEEVAHQTNNNFFPLTELKLDAIISDEIHPLNLSQEEIKRLANVLNESIYPKDAAPVSEVLLESYFRTNFNPDRPASSETIPSSYKKLRPKKPRVNASVNSFATSSVILLLKFGAERIDIEMSATEDDDNTTARTQIDYNDCFGLLGTKISDLSTLNPNQKLNLCWNLLMNLEYDQSTNCLQILGYHRLIPSRSIQMAFRIKTNEEARGTFLLTRLSCERSGHLRILVYDSSKNIVWTHLVASDDTAFFFPKGAGKNDNNNIDNPNHESCRVNTCHEKEQPLNQIIVDDDETQASLSSEVARYLVETCYSGANNTTSATGSVRK